MHGGFPRRSEGRHAVRVWGTWNGKGGVVDIEKVMVVGAGYMGGGIAQVAAQAGYRVVLVDKDERSLNGALQKARWSLDKLASKGRITPEERGVALRNIFPTTDIREGGDADLVVEAVPEDMELKREIFASLEENCRRDAVLATNTSAIPITSIAAAVKDPRRVVGIHFFGPVPLMRLCEVVRGLLTSGEVMRVAERWAADLGKETVLVHKDHAGFVANRVNIPASLEAVRMVEEGFADPEEVDRASGGYDLGVGPMQIMDNAGLEVSYNASMAVYGDTGEEAFRPPSLLRRLVAAGCLGRKTGTGFYRYEDGKRTSLNPSLRRKRGGGEDEERNLLISRRLFLAAFCEAVKVVESGVASPADVDKACRLGFNFPAGPLEIADGMGLDEVLSSLRSVMEATGSPAFSVPPLLRRMAASGWLGRRTGRGFYEYD
jgi:3-hydroxyacyl-CoA dehydrogenase